MPLPDDFMNEEIIPDIHMDADAFNRKLIGRGREYSIDDQQQSNSNVLRKSADSSTPYLPPSLK